MRADGPTSRATVVLARLIAALSLALVCTGAGCSAPAPSPTVNRSGSSSGGLKQGTGAVRHDLKPLTRRFSGLGTPVSATWMPGSLASGAPGPSTYWIDAVVEVTPATARSWAELAPTAATSRPQAQLPVLDAVPAGTLLSSPTLDAALTQKSFGAKVWLVEGTNTIVLVSPGD